MKYQACYSTHLGCAGRRVHFEQPDIPRGVQYISVPEDRDDLIPIFCSHTCALYAGYAVLSTSPDRAYRCDRCSGKFPVYHALRWVCV